MSNKDFDWGVLPQEYAHLYNQENLIDHTYEKYYTIKEGDIVLDIGANVGSFSYSILDRKPKRIIAVEPSDENINVLEKNLQGTGATILHKALSNKDAYNVCDPQTPINSTNKYNATTLKTILDNCGLSHVDFMKFDCEGAERFIFNLENRDLILKNIDNVAGEWHIVGEENGVEKFIFFRDYYLSFSYDYHIEERNGKDITNEIFEEDYLLNFNDWWSKNNPFMGQFIVYARFKDE